MVKQERYVEKTHMGRQQGRQYKGKRKEEGEQHFILEQPKGIVLLSLKITCNIYDVYVYENVFLNEVILIGVTVLPHKIIDYLTKTQDWPWEASFHVRRTQETPPNNQSIAIAFCAFQEKKIKFLLLMTSNTWDTGFGKIDLSLTWKPLH